MKSVNSVHVQIPGWSEHHCASSSWTTVRVGRRIVASAVRLGLDEKRRYFKITVSKNENGSNEVTGNVIGWSFEELAIVFFRSNVLGHRSTSNSSHATKYFAIGW
jgi:hypothetical protein